MNHWPKKASSDLRLTHDHLSTMGMNVITPFPQFLLISTRPVQFSTVLALADSSALKEPGYSSTQVRQIILITREHKCHPYLFWKVFFPALRIRPAHDFVQGARWWPFDRLNFIWEMRRVSRGPCLGLKCSSTPFQPWNTPAEAQIPYFSGGNEDNSSCLEFQ